MSEEIRKELNGIIADLEKEKETIYKYASEYERGEYKAYNKCIKAVQKRIKKYEC